MQNFIASLPSDYQKILADPNSMINVSDILHNAAREGDVELIEFIAKHAKNVDWNEPNSSGYSPLKLAALFKHEEAVKALIKVGATIKGSEVLHDAAREGNVELIKFIAKHTQDIDWNEPNSSGYSPLRLAALFKHEEAVKALIKVGATIKGSEVLHDAAREGNAELIEFIAKHDKNVDWNEPNSSGLSPLKFAVFFKHSEAVKALIKAGTLPQSPKEADYVEYLSLIDNFPIYNQCLVKSISAPIIKLLSCTYSQFLKSSQIYQNILHLSKHNTLHKIIYTTAIDESYTIELVNSLVASKPEIGGYHNADSKRVVVKLTKQNTFPKGVFIHELSHKLMYQIFDNGGNPYIHNADKTLYKQAIGKVLENIFLYYYKIYSLQSILELLPTYYSASTLEFGKLLSDFDLHNAAKTGNTKIIEFLSKHVKNLNWFILNSENKTPLEVARPLNHTETAEALKAAIFVEYGHNNMTHIDSNKICRVPSHLMSAYNTKKHQTIMNCAGWTVKNFLVIYDDNHYQEFQEDREFIVRYPEAIAAGCYDDNPLVQKILEPIRIYWETVVEKKIEAYNQKHDESEYSLANDSIWEFLGY